MVAGCPVSRGVGSEEASADLVGRATFWALLRGTASIWRVPGSYDCGWLEPVTGPVPAAGERLDRAPIRSIKVGTMYEKAESAVESKTAAELRAEIADYAAHLERDSIVTSREVRSDSPGVVINRALRDADALIKKIS